MAVSHGSHAIEDEPRPPRKAANKLNIFNGRFNPSMRFLGRRGSGHVEAAAAAFRFVIRFV